MKRILIFLLFVPTFAYCNWNDGLGDDIAMAAGAADRKGNMAKLVVRWAAQREYQLELY